MEVMCFLIGEEYPYSYPYIHAGNGDELVYRNVFQMYTSVMALLTDV